MRTYFFLVGLSALFCYAASRWLARVATERHWARRQDDSSGGLGVPRLGGVAVLVASLCPLILLLLWNNDAAHQLELRSKEALGLLAAMACVFVLGLYDDLRGARPWHKLAAQTLAGVILWFAGFHVDLLTNPFTGEAMALGWLSLPVTLLWLIAISNAFNLIDGLDGLAAGVGLFSTLALFLLALMTQQPFIAILGATLAGALLGFLPNNFAPARIYLGDSGSLTVGLALAALAIRSSQKGSVLITISIPLMIFGLPLLDAGVTTVRRFLSGHPIFRRDEEHLHHRMVKMGLSQRTAVIALYGVAAAFALSSLLLVNYQSSVAPLIAVLCGLLAWMVVRLMDYAEFTELDSHVRVALGSQRAILRNQILIHKAADEMKNAAGIDEAWEIAGRVFGALEFDSANCSLTMGPGRASVTLRWNNPSGGDAPSDAPEQWTMTVPLSLGGQRIGVVGLSRRIARGTTLFRVASLIDFLSGPFAERVAPPATRELRDEETMPESKSA